MTLKMKNAALFLLMFMVLFMLTPSSTYAAEGALKEVKGYEDLDKTDLSVSNVTKTLDAKALDPELDAYFVTKAPTVITTLNDGATFSVVKMEKIAENAYRSVGNDLPITGKVKVWLINPSDPAEQIQNTVDASQLKEVVSGTEKQFQVEYNAAVKAINLASKTPYTAVGGEMAKGDGIVKNATLNTSKIYKDGTEVALTAYNINGNNYFKLRDIASTFNIGVTWNSSTNTVGIDTSLHYVAE